MASGSNTCVKIFAAVRRSKASRPAFWEGLGEPFQSSFFATSATPRLAPRLHNVTPPQFQDTSYVRVAPFLTCLFTQTSGHPLCFFSQ